MAHLGHTRLAGGCLLVPTNADGWVVVMLEMEVVAIVVAAVVSVC